MERRYQVFVSSTYEDLREERQEVIQALLELDCIPSGMELFPAANEDQWTLIKSVIDECDYYIVIVGGRYGSVGAGGLSYTEMEYRYAIENAKPVIAFLHKDPQSLPARKFERDEASLKRLEDFRSLVRARMCRFWQTPAELGSLVSRSIIRLIRAHPSIGWIRGDQVPEDLSGEILRLKSRIEELELELLKMKDQPPPGTESLAQGNDEFEVRFTFEVEEDDYSDTEESSLLVTWNDLFSEVAPLMIAEASEANLRETLNNFVEDRMLGELREQEEYRYKGLYDFEILDSTFHTIKIQLRALGLIIRSDRKRGASDVQTYWSLTPYGDALMTRLRAIRKISFDHGSFLEETSYGEPSD